MEIKTESELMRDLIRDILIELEHYAETLQAIEDAWMHDENKRQNRHNHFDDLGPNIADTQIESLRTRARALLIRTHEAMK